jgi:hypothetical protein
VIDEYKPAAQPTQLDDAAAPVVVRYNPAAHAVHNPDEAKPVLRVKNPAGQPVHTDVDSPVTVEKYPAAQPVHTVTPVLTENWPAAHAGHAELWPTAEENVPRAQPLQLVDAAAPKVVKYSPAAHAVHADVASPVNELKRPAAHGVHPPKEVTPVLEVYVPAGQPAHAVRPKLEANCPAAHERQAAPWPVAVEYVPNAHPMQFVDAAAPSVVKYRPAAHAVHADVARPVSE